ncbi:hypothetical protein [Streptosporangium sp. NPDC003464]
MRCTPDLRYATLRWIWERPGPAGGWQLRLPDADDGQVLRPPRRGMPPHEVASWLEEALAAHSWRQHSPVRWPPFLPPPIVTEIPILRAGAGTGTEAPMTS